MAREPIPFFPQCPVGLSSHAGLQIRRNWFIKRVSDPQSYESHGIHLRAVTGLVSWLVCLSSTDTGRGQVEFALAGPGQIISMTP